MSTKVVCTEIIVKRKHPIVKRRRSEKAATGVDFQFGAGSDEDSYTVRWREDPRLLV